MTADAVDTHCWRLAMGTTDTTTRDTGAPTVETTADMKLEVVVIPVADADRAKEFYQRLGWRLDADFAFDNAFRVVQFTPPGSAASIQFGTKITTAAPGSAQGLYLVVSDIEAARDRARRPRRRDQRGLPSGSTGRAVRAGRRRPP